MSRYQLCSLDVEDLPDGLECPEGCTGVGLVFRRGMRPIGFGMTPLAGGQRLDRQQLVGLAGAEVARVLLADKLYEELADRQPAPPAPPPPVLSIAICTKDRAERLGRLLESLLPAVAASPFADTEILVIDNASVDGSTRAMAARFPGVRYVFEPKAGLNFARNAAVHAAAGDLLAYLDDDVVVDPGWTLGLHQAWLSRPDAGGFTGLVLPFKLDTDAQIAFEERGGFGRGFARREFAATSSSNDLHPVGAGSLGAGCNMAFDRRLLLELGGFDDALDTGAPLPGGGDLDIFYRVLRAGRTMVYEPSYLIFHEHRQTLPQLKRQYWTWGLGFMAFLVKSWRADAALNPKQAAMVRWWFLDRARALLGSARLGRWRDAGFVFAETWGGIVGLAGEYDRSLRRVAAIRDAQP